MIKDTDIIGKAANIIYASDVEKSMIDIFNGGGVKADSCYMGEMHENFRLLKQNVIVFGGVGNHGKSTMLNQIMLLRAKYTGQKFGIFTPENMPVEYYYLDLIHMYTGLPNHAWDGKRIELDELNEAIKFVNKHFFVIAPKEAPTPKTIFAAGKELYDKEGIDGIVLDPFNQLDHDWMSAGGRDDRYISKFLQDCKRFGQRTDTYFFIVAHTKGSIGVKDDGRIKIPSVFDLAGGAIWNSSADDIVFIHRENKILDPKDPHTLFISSKIKKPKICGICDSKIFEYNYFKNRFLVNGIDPFIYKLETNSLVGDDAPAQELSELNKIWNKTETKPFKSDAELLWEKGEKTNEIPF